MRCITATMTSAIMKNKNERRVEKIVVCIKVRGGQNKRRGLCMLFAQNQEVYRKEITFQNNNNISSSGSSGCVVLATAHSQRQIKQQRRRGEAERKNARQRRICATIHVMSIRECAEASVNICLVGMDPIE